MATIPELPASTSLALTDLFIKSQNGETQKIAASDLIEGLTGAYITESNISTTVGTWSYRKYSDGSCDLWGVFNVTPSSSTASGSVYYSDIIYVSTPFALSTGTLTGAAENLCWIANPSIATSTSRIAFRLMRGTAITTGSAISVRLSVHGVF